MVYAILIKGEWYLATSVKASRFSEPREPPQGLGLSANTQVWSEYRTTAFLGIVGDETWKVHLIGYATSKKAVEPGAEDNGDS
jgi:hypothetical protein